MSEIKLKVRTIDAFIKWIERCLFHSDGYNAPTQKDLHAWLKHAKKFKREQDNLKADVTKWKTEANRLYGVGQDIEELRVELEAKLRESEKERNKWRNYMPDDEDLAELKKQARYKGEYKDSLAANHVYIIALETRFRESETRLQSLREYAQHKEHCGLFPKNWGGDSSTHWQPTCTCGLKELEGE